MVQQSRKVIAEEAQTETRPVAMVNKRMNGSNTHLERRIDEKKSLELVIGKHQLHETQRRVSRSEMHVVGTGPEGNRGELFTREADV
jgi:hypothetical protein